MPQDQVTLRRVTRDDAELLERWETPEYTGEFNLLGGERRPLRRAIEENGLVTELGGTLIVEVLPVNRPR